MDVFDYINAVFSRKLYKEVPENIVKRHYFMLNRFMSIKYPKEANRMNLNGISTIPASLCWHLRMVQLFASKPGWLRTPTNKASKEKIVSRFSKLDKDAVKEYMKKNMLDSRDWDFLVEMDDKDAYDMIKRIEVMRKGDKE